jgi:hypothetical protein
MSSTVKIQNKTEHDITIHVKNAQGLSEALTVPSSRENPDNRKEIVFGEATCDAMRLGEAVAKGNDALKAVFDLGHLVVIEEEPDHAAAEELKAKLDADEKAAAEGEGKKKGR